MTYVVRVRGLPWHASREDLQRFFGDLVIIELLTCSEKSGRPSGEALVCFKDFESVAAALRCHKKYLGSRYLEVYESSLEELEKRRHTKISSAISVSTDGVLRLRGLPFNVSPGEVSSFFTGFDVKPQSVTFGYLIDGPHAGAPSGEAWVQFPTPGCAEKALEAKQGAKLGQRYIEIFPSSKADRDKLAIKPAVKSSLNIDASSESHLVSGAVIKRLAGGRILVQQPQLPQPSAGSRRIRRDNSEVIFENIRQLADKDLPRLVQAGERNSEEWRAHWNLHCKCNGSNDRKDPHCHSPDFLRQFLMDVALAFEHYHWMHLFFEMPSAEYLKRTMGCGRTPAFHKMVAHIRKKQESCPRFRRRWTINCNTLGFGKHDPMIYLESFLSQFLASDDSWKGDARPSTAGCSNGTSSLREEDVKPLPLPSSTSNVSSEILPGEELDPCSICLEPPEDPMITKCKHIFCESCILDWAILGRKT